LGLLVGIPVALGADSRWQFPRFWRAWCRRFARRPSIRWRRCGHREL